MNDLSLELILEDIANEHKVQEETLYHYSIKKYAYMTEYEKKSLDESYWFDEAYCDDKIKEKYEINNISGADKDLKAALYSVLRNISFPNTDILPRLTTAFISNSNELVLKSFETKQLEHEKNDSLTYETEYEIYIRIIKTVDYDKNKFLKTIEMFNNLRIYNKELEEI
ncbi:hypothetical protein [Rhodopseudomonas parapalustris]